jgi:hypothetical protein
MAKPTRGPALRSLSAAERAQVLDALLRTNPELAAEAERIAQDLLVEQDREGVAEDVARQLQALNLGDLAGRAGRQRGGGYVEPWEAAYEMLEEVIAPFLADLSRRAAVGARDAAVEIGCGVLLGLHSCRNCDDDNLVLTHAGLPDTVDDLASQVLSAMAKAGLAITDDWLGGQCPQWVGLSEGR